LSPVPLSMAIEAANATLVMVDLRPSSTRLHYRHASITFPNRPEIR
jgi:hypothetical protein